MRGSVWGAEETRDLERRGPTGNLSSSSPQKPCPLTSIKTGRTPFFFEPSTESLVPRLETTSVDESDMSDALESVRVGAGGRRDLNRWKDAMSLRVMIDWLM